LSISFPENVDFNHAAEEVILSLEPEKEQAGEETGGFEVFGGFALEVWHSIRTHQLATMQNKEHPFQRDELVIAALSLGLLGLLRSEISAAATPWNDGVRV
jgi:hypothetical protein